MNPIDAGPARDNSSLIDRACPVCGENQVVTHRHQDSFKYGSGDSAVTLHVELPVRRCEACEFEFLDREGERIKQEAVCRHLGVLTSTEIRGIRERYRMTRASFAELTGLGEATLNRWENGVLIQNRANDRYLRLLAMPDIFDRLSHLSDRPFSSQQLDFEAGDSHHEFSKAAVPITKRPPAALVDVHLKSYGGWNSPDNMKFIEEYAVDKERIEALFKQAYYSVYRDDDDDLVVNDELHVFVFIHEMGKRIRFMALINANEDVDMSKKLEIVNRINDEYTFCRIYVPSGRPDVLGADLELTFEGGIVPLHVISLFRKFIGSVTHSILEHGQDIA